MFTFKRGSVSFPRPDNQRKYNEAIDRCTNSRYYLGISLVDRERIWALFAELKVLADGPNIFCDDCDEKFCVKLKSLEIEIDQAIERSLSNNALTITFVK
jgi:hypothetical protein